MLAYQTQDLDNAEILLNAKKWHKNKLLSDQNWEAIKLKYPDLLYTPTIFIRIGLFIFTVISAFSAFGLFMLMTDFNGDNSEFTTHCIVDGIILLALLEVLIHNKKLYKSGIDDALLYMGLSSIICGFCLLFNENSYVEEPTLILFCCISLPFLLAACIRYSDRLVAATTFVCVFLLIFLLISKTGASSKFTLPFITMLFSTGCYFAVVKVRKLAQLRFWDSSCWIIEILSLLVFYLAGNYFVVRTLSSELFNMHLMEGEDIPFAFFFYAFTALVPLLYIFMGLKNKNRVLLLAGLAILAASVMTFKYYFSLGHHEISLTIGGIIMLVVAYFSIRYFKTPKYGITYAEDKEENRLGNFDAEALIIAQTFSSPQHNSSENNPDFGGGKFGGGGADDNY